MAKKTRAAAVELPAFTPRVVPAPEAVDFFSPALEVGGLNRGQLVFFEKRSRRLVYDGPTLEEFLAHPRTRPLSKTEALRVNIYDYDAYMQSREMAIGEDGEEVSLAPPRP